MEIAAGFEVTSLGGSRAIVISIPPPTFDAHGGLEYRPEDAPGRTRRCRSVRTSLCIPTPALCVAIRDKCRVHLRLNPVPHRPMQVWLAAGTMYRDDIYISSEYGNGSGMWRPGGGRHPEPHMPQGGTNRRAGGPRGIYKTGFPEAGARHTPTAGNVKRDGWGCTVTATLPGHRQSRSRPWETIQIAAQMCLDP